MLFYAFIAVGNLAARQRFKERVNIHDLRVNAGSWTWTEENPRPSWPCLSHARVWHEPEAKYIAAREAVKRGPVELQVVPGGTESCTTINVHWSDRDVPVTIYIARPTVTTGAGVHPDAADHAVDFCIAWVDERPVPRHLWKVVTEGKPTLMVAANPTFLDEVRRLLHPENADLRWLDIQMYIRPKEVSQFTTYGMVRKYAILVGPGLLFVEKV